MKKQLLICASLALLALGCSDSDNQNGGATNPGVAAAGYLYTITNGESINKIVRFTRMADGSLTNETTFSTNSNGGANTAAGGDAHGDFDFQGSIRIVGNYLLNVNAGGNTISVFALDRNNGNLTLMGNTDSMGKRPVSITESPISGSPNEYWLAIANQWDNPNVQKDVPNVQRFPNDAFFMNDLTQPDASDAMRNIQLFRFNATNGALTYVSQIDTYVRENGGPSQVLFSNDGSKLAVSTWGIAHFGTAHPSLSEQHPSRVYIYDFNNGTATNRRFFEEQGIAGTIGITWAKNNNSLLYASNFNTTSEKTNSSVTVLSDGGSSVAKTNNLTSGGEMDLDEACWTTINSAGDKLYVASFASNVITTYALASSGDITSKLQVEHRGNNAPESDSKDVYITTDGKYLYNTGAFQSFSISIFDVNSGGVNYRNQTIINATSDRIGQPGAYNLMGLAGFDVP